MADQAARITRLIQRSDALPWGRETTAALGEAIALADAAGEEQLAHAARMRLVQNAQMVDDTELVLATFAVCDDAYRRDPLRFPANPAEMKLPGLDYPFADLYWMWKWVPGLLMNHPRFDRTTVEEALDDLEDTYARAGITSRAVPQNRFTWALQRGDEPAIRRWRDALATLPDDDYSDCAACSREDLIDAALHLGDDDRALEVLAEVVDGGFSCAEQPARALSRCLAPLARRGDADAVRRGVAEILANLDMVTANLGAAGRLVTFLAQAGRADRGLAIARRALPLMGEQPLNGGGQLSLLTALAVCCGALVEQGHGTWPMPQCDDPALRPWFVADAPHTVASVAATARVRAEELARAFDARDGSDRTSRDLARALAEGATERFTIDLDLPPDPGAAFLATDGDPGLLFRLGDAPVPVPADASDALRIATHLCRGHRYAESVEVLRTWLPRLDDPVARAAAVHRLGVALANGPRAAEVDTAALGADLVRALEPLGWPEAQQVFTDLGAAAFVAGPSLDAQQASALIDAWQDAGLSAGAVGLGASFLLEDLDPGDPRLPALGEAGHAAWRRLGAHPAWPAPRQAPIRVRAQRGPEPGATALDDLVEQALAEGADGLDAAILWSFRSRAATDPGQAFDAALTAFRLATPWAAAGLRAQLAGALLVAALQAGRGSEVIATAAHLRQLAPSLPPGFAVEVLSLVQSCLLDVRQVALAEAAASEALELLPLVDPPHPGQAGGVHRLAAAVAREAGDTARAIELSLTAADLFADAGDVLAASEAAAEAGFLQLGRAHAQQAGQLAETILELLADHPDAWAHHLRGRHLLALAAGRVPDLPPAVVEQAFADALALAGHPPTEADADLAASVAEELTEAHARWLRHQPPREES